MGEIGTLSLFAPLRRGSASVLWRFFVSCKLDIVAFVEARDEKGVQLGRATPPIGWWNTRALVLYVKKRLRARG